MAVSEKLKGAVAQKQIVDIRDCLFGLLALDLGLKDGGKFDEALKYCLANGIGEAELFEDDDGKELPSESTKENMSAICAMMGANFSKRKLNKAKDMGKKLYPHSSQEESEKKNQGGARTAENRTYRQGRKSGRESSDSGIPWLLIGAAVAVIVVAAIAIKACCK